MLAVIVMSDWNFLYAKRFPTTCNFTKTSKMQSSAGQDVEADLSKSSEENGSVVFKLKDGKILRYKS